MTHVQEIPVPGSEDTLVSWGEGALLLRTERGSFLRLNQTPTGLLSGVAPSPAVADFLQRLGAERARASAEARERRFPRGATAFVVGDSELAEKLVAALRGWGAAAEPASARDAAAHAGPDDLLLGVADTVVQREGWELLDAASDRGTGWIRTFREGALAWVDPLRANAEGASAEQVLARRWAASNAPQAWQAWRQARVTPPHAAPLADSAATAHQLSRVLSLVTAWASGPTVDDLTLLQRYDGVTGELTRHRVLGFDQAPPTALSSGALGAPGAP